MKGIFFTIAALGLLSATVFGKGEPCKEPGAPTGYPDMKKVTPIKVSYDDDDAMQKAVSDPYYINWRSTKDSFLLARTYEYKDYIYYYENMGNEGQKLNLNYGNNTRLAPIHGAIR